LPSRARASSSRALVRSIIYLSRSCQSKPSRVNTCAFALDDQAIAVVLQFIQPAVAGWD
jgi:hypothetical protein